MRDDTQPAPYGHDDEPASAIDDVIRHERELDLAPEEAWELLGTSEGLEQWLGERVELDIEPGAEGTIVDGDELLLTEVESVEPGRRVSLRWWSEKRGAAVVDLTLESLSDDRTRLVVTEIPVRAFEIPATPAFSAPGRPSGGPQLLGSASALVLA